MLNAGAEWMRLFLMGQLSGSVAIWLRVRTKLELLSAGALSGWARSAKVIASFWLGKYFMQLAVLVRFLEILNASVPCRFRFFSQGHLVSFCRCHCGNPYNGNRSLGVPVVATLFLRELTRVSLDWRSQRGNTVSGF